MRASTEGGGRLRALLAVLVLVCATVAACGGDDDDGDEAAPTTDTGGTAKRPESPSRSASSRTTRARLRPRGPDLGRRDAPADHRGATPVSGDPTEGVENATIAGHPIEIVYGGPDSTPDKAVEEARRLVEQEQVDILVGPLSGSEGIAVAEYSKEQPASPFVNWAQDTTLTVRFSELLRFHNDGTQWTAGPGNYAYNELGRRNVVTIGDDYDFPYSQVAGFVVAEFCSIGGNVTERRGRLWGEEAITPCTSRRSLEDVDGFKDVGGTGIAAFVKQYQQLRQPRRQDHGRDLHD